MNQIEKRSPSGKKSLLLTFKDELHFGPYLFSFEPQGFSIQDDIGFVTEEMVWSENDQYLALVEIQYKPECNLHTSLLKAVDTNSGTVQTIASRNGRLSPKSVSDKGDVAF